MQKKLIALAVAGLVAAPAFAQSNVTIYGVADLSFDNVKAGGAAVSGDSMPGRNRVSANSSYIGFKGAESLGNGMTAVFQFENGLTPDSTGGAWTSRDSYVGLAGGFGTVAMGTLTGPTRGLGASMDVNAGATGIGANSSLLGKLGGHRITNGANCGSSTVCASVFDTRWSNTIAYISPAMSGFSVTVAYVANENKTRDGLNGTAGQLNTRGYDIGFKYDNGPIMAALTQNQAKIGDTADTKATDTRLGFKYAPSNFSVGLLWDRVKLDDNAGTNLKRTGWFLPVTFTMGAGKLIAQYGKAGDVTGTSDTGAKHFSLGYEYSLSKRTMVKAVWSQVTNEQNAYYDYGVNAVGTSGTASGFDPKGFQVGIRHSF
jgi:predicted porin